MSNCTSRNDKETVIDVKATEIELQIDIILKEVTFDFFFKFIFYLIFVNCFVVHTNKTMDEKYSE